MQTPLYPQIHKEEGSRMIIKAAALYVLWTLCGWLGACWLNAALGRPYDPVRFRYILAGPAMTVLGLAACWLVVAIGAHRD